MARRPAPISYAASLIVEQPGTSLAVATPVPATTGPTRQLETPEQRTSRPVSQIDIEGAGEGRARRPLEDKSDPSVLYLHPVGKKALRLYAVEKGVKVHDLLLEALEEWASARGLTGPWRVPSSGPARRRRQG
jgi:hypothetical protein